MPGDIKVLAAVGDDTVAPPVATDRIGGRDYQKVKLVFGPDGTYYDVEDGGGQELPIGGNRIGAINEAAPGSDIANAGLNGRLQRISQRLTTLIGQLPLSLGQKPMAASLAVALAVDQPSVTTTESRLPATLGQKTMVGGVAVTIASDQSAIPVTLIRRETLIVWTVASGATLSDAVDTTGYDNMALFVPSEFDGTTIAFYASTTLGGIYYPCYDITNTPVGMTVAAGRVYDLPGELLALRFLKLMCGTTQTTSNTVFSLALRS